MLETLFGSKTAERVLTYLWLYREGYPSELARIFSSPLNMIQKQLAKLEAGGILASQLRGKVRMYKWNARYPFLKELNALLEKNYEYTPEVIKEKYYRHRTRPRRAGKA